MKIELKCFSTLVKPDSCDFKDSTMYELNDGQTVDDLMKKANIEKEKVKIVFVNSRIVHTNTVLSDGDQVGLAPSTGGM